MKHRFYNSEEKEEFLKTINSEEVRKIYEHLFLKSKGAETLYQKDLYSFTLEQIEDVMRNINPATMNSAANNKSRLNNYMSWAITNGRRTNNINPIHGLGRDWERKFIDKNTKRFLSESELNDIIEGLYNAQDKALIQCIFEGILGQGFSELISMRYSKIDWTNNKVSVIDKRSNKEREVQVSDKCLQFIKEAYYQVLYRSEETDTEKELVEYEDYIFKNVKWRTSKFPRITKDGIGKRIYIVKEKYELEEFKAKTIQESGMNKMAADLYKSNGKLDKEEFIKIGEQFNLSKIRVDGYEYYDIRKMKNQINEKTLKELYDIDVKID